MALAMGVVGEWQTVECVVQKGADGAVRVFFEGYDR